MSKNLIIKQYEIGPMNNFVYLIGDDSSKEMAVIDPAWDVNFLSHEAQKLNCTITKIFLTHGHPDHVNGVEELVTKHHLPVYISYKEKPLLRKPFQNLHDLKENDKFAIGKIEFDVINTPGHTPGCQCLYYNVQGETPLLFTGDTLFIDGCGRCDLPGGDAKTMYNSLYNIIMKLPDETIIYSGHNYGLTPHDTIGHQKQTNPYLQCANLEEFLGERMG